MTRRRHRSPLFPYTTLFRSPSDGMWPRLSLLVGDLSHSRTVASSHLLFVDLETTGIAGGAGTYAFLRSEEHTSELQSQSNLVCRPLLEKKTGTSRRGRRAGR